MERVERREAEPRGALSMGALVIVVVDVFTLVSFCSRTVAVVHWQWCSVAVLQVAVEYCCWFRARNRWCALAAARTYCFQILTPRSVDRKVYFTLLYFTEYDIKYYIN